MQGRFACRPRGTSCAWLSGFYTGVKLNLLGILGSVCLRERAMAGGGQLNGTTLRPTQRRRL